MEVLNSFFSNIKDKLTNPFFGTLILVLIINHWELWYAGFNFGDNYTLKQKLNFIENYITINLNFTSFLWDIGQALIYMFIGYIIVVGTRSLVLWIEYGLMPYIIGKVINKNVVTKSEYDRVVKEREDYFDQYEEQRENVRKFSKTIDEQTKQIKSKDKDLLEQSENISKTVRSLDICNKKIEQLEKSNEKKENNLEQAKKLLDKFKQENSINSGKIKLYRNLFFGKENQKFYNSINKFPPEVLNKYRELKHDNKWLTFLGVANFFEFGGTISGELIEDMIKMECVVKYNNHESLTPVGSILWDYRKLFDQDSPM